MGTKGKILGKDGQWYDTPSEKFSADFAWNVKQGTQEKQNRLLQQHNKLLEQQMQMQYDLEQEKIQKDYEKEMKKLQHKEKMRLYKLFDDVGISKETYDTFINTNFLNKTTVNLMEQRDEHLLMSSKYDYLLHEDENEEKYGYDNYNATMEKYGMYDLRDVLMDDECYDKVSKSKQKERNDLESWFNKSKLWFKWSIISLFAVIFLLILHINFFENSDWLAFITVMSILFVPIALLLSGLLMYRFNKDLERFPTKTFSSEKYLTKLNKLMLEEQEAADKTTEIIKSNSKNQVSMFCDFRINHYNASIEKLLVDAGFKDLVESLGLEYKRVNNSNKKKDGTIEDYIEYFETNS